MIAGASITLAVLEVVAAPSRAVLKTSYYAAPSATIHVTVPAGSKEFPTDLLPQ
jgi:hypothetical protein